jgi:catechol 2,3-dioxygenase-like lactoylglutathione lyase family enzyme
MPLAAGLRLGPLRSRVPHRHREGYRVRDTRLRELPAGGKLNARQGSARAARPMAAAGGRHPRSARRITTSRLAGRPSGGKRLHAARRVSPRIVRSRYVSPCPVGDVLPQISIEVGDVDDVHSRAVSRGLHIVYPITNEPWGVRRFFVTDPNGTVINVMCHMGGTKSD